MKFNKGQMFGLAVILGALSTIAYQVSSEGAVVTFYTPEEIYAEPRKYFGKTFRVPGPVLNGTKNWDPEKSYLTFRMTDLKNHEFTVHYQGIPPDLFKEGQGVIVEGKLASENLTADNRLNATLLLVKHSEVYDTEKDHTKLREAKLLDSILKPQ